DKSSQQQRSACLCAEAPFSPHGERSVARALLVAVQNWHTKAGCGDHAAARRYLARDRSKIVPRSLRDHSTFMKICGEFASKREPGFQSSLLWWRPEKRP